MASQPLAQRMASPVRDGEYHLFSFWNISEFSMRLDNSWSIALEAGSS
jgi:hypothetical protein